MSWNIVPRLCQWDITHKCNLDCIHCRALGLRRGSEDLFLTQIKTILKSLFEFSPKVHMALAGGEPLARPDLREILEFIKKINSETRVELLTNGTLICSENIGWLSENIRGFNVSLEGARPEINDPVRGKGAFKKTLCGIKILAERNLLVCVRMTYLHQGENEIYRLMRFLPETGVRRFNLRYVVPVGSARGISISSKQYGRISRNVYALGKELGLIVGFSDPFPELLVNSSRADVVRADRQMMCGEKVGGCSMAFDLLYIDPNGIVRACPYFPKFCGDAKSESLRKIWMESQMLEVLRKIRSCLSGACGSCEFKFACGGCRGAAYASRDILGADPRCWKF